MQRTGGDLARMVLVRWRFRCPDAHSQLRQCRGTLMAGTRRARKTNDDSSITLSPPHDQGCKIHALQYSSVRSTPEWWSSELGLRCRQKLRQSSVIFMHPTFVDAILPSQRGSIRGRCDSRLHNLTCPEWLASSCDSSKSRRRHRPQMNWSR